MASPTPSRWERIGIGYRLYHLGAEVDVMVYTKEVAVFAPR